MLKIKFPLPVSKAKRENYAGMKRFGEAYDTNEARVGDYIDNVDELAKEAYAYKPKSVEERFGSQIDRTRDQVNQGRSEANQTVKTALIASGGDVTGSGATTLNAINQNANQTVGDVINKYTTQNESINLREKQFANSRGDRLTMAGLNSSINRSNTALQQMNNYEQRELMRRQANKQLVGDIIGAVAGTAGAVLGRGG